MSPANLANVPETWPRVSPALIAQSRERIAGEFRVALAGRDPTAGPTRREQMMADWLRLYDRGGLDPFFAEA